ncbi:MAG: sterol desaturase family protein [Sphingomonadales bacterium]|nr:sterol desaturase family protein [Sphingomonadales bacterium]
MDIARYSLWITVGAAVILAGEVVAGRHKGIYGRKGEVPLIALSMGVGRFLLGPLAGILVARLYGLLLPGSRGALAHTPFWLALPAILLANEFAFYWVHRLAHRSRTSLLAMLHRTHHSAAYMNVAVYMRLNLWWYFVIPNAWTVGLELHLGLTDAAGVAILVTAVWNVFTHSDFRWDDGLRAHPRLGRPFRALEHVLVTPGLHHTHHGFGRDGAAYRNFGVVLSVWDWAFGTLHIPAGRPARYGIPGHNAHWPEELLYPLVRINSEPRP